MKKTKKIDTTKESLILRKHHSITLYSQVVR